MNDKHIREEDVVLQGRMLSPGMGSGDSFVYRDTLGRLDEYFDIEESDVADEIERFARAVAKVSADLDALAKRVGTDMDQALSDVFRAHITMVQDPSLKSEVETDIQQELVSAGSAVKTVFRRWERRFQRMEMEVAKHKADDVRDLAKRLIRSLAGVRAHALEELPEGCVLIARQLLPSDTVYLARRKASAALLEHGGTGSHAALFAREIGLPCITGIADAVDRVPSSTPILVDADKGRALVLPSQTQRRVFKEKYDKLQRNRSKARESALEPAVSKGGQLIKVYANVACEDDTRQALDNGADGIGLYRIEQVFLGLQSPPDPDLLTHEVRKTLEPAKHLPLYVRLLDVGADKPLPFLESLRETNPALGQRGVRFLRAYPDLLRVQLEILLQLSTDLDLHILVPMVTVPDDIQVVKQQLLDLASESGVSPPELGAMIETPAAALSLPRLAEHADFLSFGTNDLTQYAFASDRENSAVEQYFDDTHEVIFRFLDIAHQDLPEMPFSVCGELAGRPEYVSRLMQYGVETLSVAPPLIPDIKQAVRQS